MYEVTPSVLTTALQSGSGNIVYSTNTINQILALTSRDNNATAIVEQSTPDAGGNVTVAAGTEVVMISQPATNVTLKPPANVPVVIFQGNAGLNVDFSAGSTTVVSGSGLVDRLVVGSAGNDSIILDSRNTQLVLGSGNSTVVAGTGHDTIQAGLGNSTIIGSTSGTTVKLSGVATEYSVTVTADHHALIKKFLIGGNHVEGAPVLPGTPGVITDVSNVQYIQLDNNQAIILANDAKEAAVASLYHTVFGRDADANGMHFWFNAADAGVSLLDIAKGFTTSAEFQALAQQTDQQFLTTLYHNTFNREGDTEGIAFWTDLLSQGLTRAEVIANFANVAGQNLDGVMNTEAVVVGFVTVIHGIV